ncbi:hypothetical protein NC651_038474 [Populus alba x Populus x berolinensis]|nr:hypothetical protein NC651_038474 [Populus alba x Populus x berolinensis]
MLFQVGGQGTRPTFFEMAAAQQLPANLCAALTYSIGVLALRRPFLHKVWDHEDEFFSLLMLVLETHSLRTTDDEVNPHLVNKALSGANLVIAFKINSDSLERDLLLYCSNSYKYVISFSFMSWQDGLKVVIGKDKARAEAAPIYDNRIPVVAVLFLLKDSADFDPAFPYFLKRAIARAPSSESSLTLPLK